MSATLNGGSFDGALVGLSLSAPAAAQTTIFNTKDFRQDRALWTDPAYYRNNTVGQLRGMAMDIDTRAGNRARQPTPRVYGSAGTGREGALNLASPYPYTSAWEHYQAWLKEARWRHEAHQGHDSRLERPLGGRGRFRRTEPGERRRHDADAASTRNTSSRK